MTSPPAIAYVLQAAGALNDTLNIGDTLAAPTVTMTVDGAPVAVRFDAAVVSGTGFMVDTANGSQRLIVLGPGDGVVRVRPVSAGLPTDTLHVDFTLHAAVPTLISTGGPGKDSIYSWKDSLQLTAQAQSSDGVPLSGIPVSWSVVSGGPAITLLNAATGLIRAEANGTVVLRATVDSATVQRTIVILQKVNKIIPPGALVIRAAGLTRQLVPQAQDGRTNGVSGVPVSYAYVSRAPAFATVTPATGLVTSVSDGNTRVVISGTTAANDTAAIDSTAVAVQLAHLGLVSGNNQNASVGTALAQPLVVQMLDPANAAVSDSGVRVVFKVVSGDARFAGVDSAVVTVDAQGRAGAPALTLGTQLAADSIRATGSGLAAPAVTFVAQAAQPARLDIVVEPVNVQAGGSPPVRVAVRDTFGAVVTSATISITAALLPSTAGGAQLLGTTAIAATGGFAQFTNLTPDSVRAGYRVVVSAPGLIPDTSVAFNVTAGAPDHLAFRVQPSNVSAGIPIAPAITVDVQDASNNVVTTDNARDVTLSIVTIPAGGSSSLNGTAIAQTVNGVATFGDIRIASPATGYRLRAAASGLASGNSALFNVVGGAVSLAIVSGNNQNDLAGVTLSPFLVRVSDAGNSPIAGDSVIFKVTVGGGTFAGIDSAIVVTNASGQAGAALTMGPGTGAQTVVARSNTIGAGTTVTFNASATAANLHLAFAAQPTSATGGTAIGPAIQVAVLDAANATVSGATTIVTLAIAGGTGAAGAALGGTVSVAATNGIASFPGVSIDRAGSGYQLTASANSVTGATSTAFNITVGAANRLVFLVQPSAAVAGAVIAPTVQVAVADAGGNVVTSATDSIDIVLLSSSVRPGSTLRGTRGKRAVNGVASFTNLSVDTAQAGVILRADASGLASATSGGFTVVPAPASRLAYSVQPASVTAGVALSAFSVTIRDSVGNTVTSASHVITLTLSTSPAGATLGGTPSVQAVGGVASFGNARLTLAGTGYRLAAAASGLAGAVSASFTVNAAPASQLVFTGQPTDAQSGVAIAPAVIVQIQDSVGNLIATATTSVTISITSGAGAAGAVLSGSPNPVAASGGVATFANLSINLQGTGYALSATSGGLASAVSSPFNVVSATSNRLVWAVEPTAMTSAGTQISPALVVHIRTPGGAATTATDSVRLRISGGSNPNAHFFGDTVVAAVNGTATFNNLYVDSAGTGYRALAFTTTGVTSATSGPLFEIIPSYPRTLSFLSGPSSRTAGNVFSPVIEVEARDSLGNRTANAFTSVMMAITPATANGATLAGTTTQNATAGVASFADLSIAKAGVGYTLTASSPSDPSLMAAVSGAFSITAGPLARVVVSPAGVTLSGGTTTLTATPQDALGNPVPGTIAWASLNPGVATVGAATGLVTAVASGQTTVTAGTGGFSATVVATVAPAGAAAVNLWVPTASGVSDAITGIWAAGPSSVYAVTDGGRTLSWNGSGWSIVHSPISATNLFGIWGVADSGQVLAGTELYQLTGPTPTKLNNDPVAAAFTGVWGLTRSDFQAVSQDGSIVRWDGSAFTLTRPSSGIALNAIYGFAAGDVYAVGNSGTILRYDGSSWTTVGGTGAAGLVFGVWGTSGADLFTVGQGGQVLRRSGTTWSSTTVAGGLNLRAVWGSSGSDVYAVGDNGAMARFDGSSWTTMTSGVGTRLHAVGGMQGTGGNDLVFVGGVGGVILQGIYGASVTVTPATPTLTSFGATLGLTAAAKDGLNVVVPGVTFTWSSSNAAVATVDVTTGVVTAISNGTATITATATGGAAGSTVVTVAQAVASVTVTPGGATLTSGGATTTFVADARDALNASIPGVSFSWSSLNSTVATVNSSTGVVAAAASGQATISATAGGKTGYALATVAVTGATPVNLWAPQTSPVGSTHMLSLWGASSSAVFAVGNSDQFARFDGTAWNSLSGPVNFSMLDVWGTSASDIFAVGQPSSAIRHFDGTAWASQAAPNAQITQAVWGSSPSDVWAVGNSGTAHHYNGTAWSSRNTGLSSQTLLGVWGTANNDVFAVGLAGAIVHFDGTSWISMTSPTTQHLRRVWGTSSNDVFAAGDAGVIVRYNGSTWSLVPSTPSTALLLGIRGTSSADVYAVGQGAIWRFDGTSWNAQPSPVASLLRNVWGLNTGEMHVVGDNGVFLRGYRGATVTVTPANPSINTATTLTATVRDAAGSTIPGVIVGWSSSNTAVATVDASTGVVTPVSNGTAIITATTAGGVSGSTTVTVNTTPVAWYPLNGNGTDVIGGINASVSGSVAAVADRQGNPSGAIEFDNSADAVSIPSYLTDSLSAGTIAFWAKANVLNQQLRLFAKYTANSSFFLFEAQYGSNGGSTPPDRLVFSSEPGRGVVSPAASYGFGNWHHYAFVWGPTGLRIYLDGVLLASDAISAGTPPFGELLLGRNRTNSNNESFIGAFDDLRIYHIALSASAIATLAATPSPTPPAASAPSQR